MKLLKVLLILIPMTIGGYAKSNEIQTHEKICNQAKDYWGCIRAMKGLNPKFRSYGPLKIEWNVWKELQGSYVAQTINRQGKGIYIAINCKKKEINVTGAKGVWKGWVKPVEDFEYKLINDLCNEEIGN